MRELDNLQSNAAGAYRNGMAVPNCIEHVVDHCLGLLREIEAEPLGACDGKQYHMLRVERNVSRPVHLPLLIRDRKLFREAWREFQDSARPQERRYNFPPEETNTVLYSASMAFAICYDLWKPASRKTPGTFFEVVLGSVLQTVLPGFERTAHVVLPGQTEKVSTDIVFLTPDEKGGLVIPAKITTRERIVQPFAHQRILDSVFGERRFRSVLISVSEMQRQGKVGANAICVPGAIRLYQLHLAGLSGLYYLDPPARYLREDVAGHVTVGSLGELLARDLPALAGG